MAGKEAYYSPSYQAVPDAGGPLNSYQASSGGFAPYYGNVAPPTQYGAGTYDTGARTGSRWNPLHWSKRTKILSGLAAAVIIIIVVVVGAVEGTKANAYPNYSYLNYSMSASFDPSNNFFHNFTYWDTYDPTSGWVHYDNPTDSTVTYNTTGTYGDLAYLRVEDKQQAPTGRHSARVTSTQTWNSGLFLFDIRHTPYGCGTWPAVWLSDWANWPNHGEIDVVEAVNQATSGVQSTLHTTNGCSMSNVKRKETGSVLDTNCYNGTNNNAGCGVQGAPDTYGAALNFNGGGVYAAELRQAGIRIWFFPRNNLPSDVSTALSTNVNDTSAMAAVHPDPTTWPEALADFPSTDCNIYNHFKNQSIIVNIDLCGTYAGSTSVYNTQDNCPDTCVTYVSDNPTAFTNAYFQFGSFRVFQAASEVAASGGTS